MKIEEIERENKIRFIKKFAKLNLMDVCREAHITRQAIYRGKMSESTINEVVEIITRKIADLWEK